MLKTPNLMKGGVKMQKIYRMNMSFLFRLKSDNPLTVL